MHISSNTPANMTRPKAEGDAQPLCFSPAIQGHFDLVAFKLKLMREALEDNVMVWQRHRKNILFLIDYYENGGEVPPPGKTMWIFDGKVVDQPPTPPWPVTSAAWAEEGLGFQLAGLVS
ncbi:hypothetical protein QBC33DRAFT_550947 [Phialemonium atrogriseum]|uniref:Uncharacterized protein n=1 Tax=Phialemonium atrogriseum TaxID=1093897 RepID=A0AAJ0FBV5_9PEZI|nr:uncharacterized protein QBC33DRAFT_550947 [Phialemonium atrogriseum]KAK1762911.1 hypothetical protein QBC33DRAFT_550947 [Phialemonium atrogriseum]